MASIKLQSNTFSIEISGNEEFVKNQYQGFVNEYGLYIKTSANSSSANVVASEPTAVSASIGGSGIENLFSFEDDGAVTINMAVSGNNKAEKIKNVALLIGYARKDDWIPTSVIAKECKRQGCWDSGNFASYVKQCEPLIMIRGKGSNKCIKITVSGIKMAEERAKMMLGEE